VGHGLDVNLIPILLMSRKLKRGLPDTSTRKESKQSDASRRAKKVKKVARDIKHTIYKDYDEHMKGWLSKRVVESKEDNKLNYSKYWLELESKGYTVIPNVVSQESVDGLLADTWEWAGLWGITKDPTTWNSNQWIPGHKHGIIQNHSAGHTKMAWQVRSEPGVMAAFANLWHCKDVNTLETSYDAINFGFPTKKENKGWFHTDQGPHRKGLWAIQGFVALTQQGPESHNGALVVREGAHKHHESFFKDKWDHKTKKDWYKYSAEELLEFVNYPEVHVVAAPGSLVLWDSRTPHYGRQPHHSSNSNPPVDLTSTSSPSSSSSISDNSTSSSSRPPTPNSSSTTSSQIIHNHPRAVVYVCMKPRTNMTEWARKKKYKWLQELRMTSHSPGTSHIYI
jgi:hypothetical protein